MTKHIALFLLLIGLSLSQQAIADCAYPSPPASTPDGKTASKEEMLAAAGHFKAYNEAVTAYTACLEKETTEKASSGGAADDIRQLKAIQKKKHNTAMKELEERVGAFNKEIAAFKARG